MAMQADDDASERLVVPVHEETIEPHVRQIDAGAVRVHKRVETVPVETTVDASRDQVTVERVRVDRPVERAPEPWQDGDTLVIPVVEEVVVTEKRLVLREEVRITRQRVTEQIPIRDTVRREVVELEEIPPPQ